MQALINLFELFTYWPITIILGFTLLILAECYFDFKRIYVFLSAIIGLLLALIMTYLPFIVNANYYPIIIGGTNYFDSLIVIDKFTIFFTTVFILAGLYVIITARYRLSQMGEEAQCGIFFMLLLLGISGMIFVSASTDLLTLFVAWELVAFPGYALVAFYTRDKLALEGSFKYFILGGASAGILLFGMSILYGFTGTTNIYTIFTILSEQSQYMPFLIVGLVTIMAGLGFEMGLVPFHWWIPDAYEGASTAIAQFLTIGSKKAGFSAIFRVLLIPLFMISSLGIGTLQVQQVISIIQILIAIVAILTMTVGNIGALRQTSIVRLLAYSSIAQAGYILIAVAVAIGAPEVNIAQWALLGGLLHVLVHSLMKGGAFAIVAVLRIIGNFKNIDDLKGLAKNSKWLAFMFSIILLSLAGIPPLLGFWSKAVLFLSAIFGNLWWLAAIAFLNSALSLFYYARIIKIMYIDIDIADEPTFELRPVPKYYWIPIGATVVALIGIGLFPQILVNQLFDVVQTILATIAGST
ncbi:MAG: NADH-quinone oxidoreductase subunit N [Candidatus Hermodarchaeota archaeon]